MELIKSVTRRSRLSEVVYVGLNLAYAGLLWLLVATFEPPYLAYVIVAISKWRIFAVRPRFWFANLQANTVDALVSVSIVTLLWLNNGDFGMQLLLTLLFAIWLVVLKPRSKQYWMVIQAQVALFVSLVALFSISYALPAVAVVVVCWLIGYSAARHVLTSYNNEPDRTTLALIWGLVVAELGWLGYHWTVAYGLNDNFKIPQIAVVISLIGFLTMKVYDMQHHNEGKLDMKVLRWPLLFVILTIGLLLFRFNGLNPT